MIFSDLIGALVTLSIRYTAIHSVFYITIQHEAPMTPYWHQSVISQEINPGKLPHFQK